MPRLQFIALLACLIALKGPIAQAQASDAPPAYNPPPESVRKAKSVDLGLPPPDQGQIRHPKADSLQSGFKLCRAELKLTEDECQAWQRTVLPLQLPPARGNRYADHPEAAYLGLRIFYDSRFSAAGTSVACSKCHHPEQAFTDRLPVSTGIRQVTRNSPTLYNSAWLHRFFWDGRADTLWSQPLFTVQHPDEFGATPLSIAHSVYSHFKNDYERVFGPLPPLSDKKRFPENGGPGNPSFDSMSAFDREAVLRVFVNFGKTLESVMRKMASGRSWVDLYLLGDSSTLTPEAKRGMAVFTRAKCLACHSGPMYTDQRPYARILPDPSSSTRDLGRAQGRIQQASNPFRLASLWSDPGSKLWMESEIEPESPALQGAFLTPSLRNVALTWPYGHHGIAPGLDELLELHLRSPAYLELKPRIPTAQEKKDLLKFLRSLNGSQPPLPWSLWLDRG